MARLLQIGDLYLNLDQIVSATFTRRKDHSLDQCELILVSGKPFTFRPPLTATLYEELAKRADGYPELQTIVTVQQPQPATTETLYGQLSEVLKRQSRET